MGDPSAMMAGAMEAPAVDTAETVHISALALLKVCIYYKSKDLHLFSKLTNTKQMLKHARAGVPMEVMGLMQGEFIDDYTVRVIDVYSMPQSGNSVSVESVDPVFQQKMLEMLGQVGRTENCVGWYHSHPGFGCWLSSVDVTTAQSFENSTPQGRGVSIVVDPIQSVRGKVCFLKKKKKKNSPSKKKKKKKKTHFPTTGRSLSIPNYKHATSNDGNRTSSNYQQYRLVRKTKYSNNNERT